MLHRSCTDLTAMNLYPQLSRPTKVHQSLNRNANKNPKVDQNLRKLMSRRLSRFGIFSPCSLFTYHSLPDISRKLLPQPKGQLKNRNLPAFQVVWRRNLLKLKWNNRFAFQQSCTWCTHYCITGHCFRPVQCCQEWQKCAGQQPWLNDSISLLNPSL